MTVVNFFIDERFGLVVTDQMRLEGNNQNISAVVAFRVFMLTVYEPPFCCLSVATPIRVSKKKRGGRWGVDGYLKKTARAVISSVMWLPTSPLNLINLLQESA